MRITVPQIFRALGITPTPSQAWSVGSRIANAYASEFGQQPPKDNRPKTSGSGSHCFALYPTDYRPRIEQIIRATVNGEASQRGLFE